MPINRIAPSSRARGAIAAVVAASIGGMVAVFAGQKPVHDDVALAITALIEPWEGDKLHAYADPLAHGLCTICAGDTSNCRLGMTETPAGCNRRLAGKLERDYRPHLVKCMRGFQAMPIAVRSMFDSLSWNIGWGGACASSAARLAVAGKYQEACRAATAFNKASGILIVGLVRRREMGDATRIGEAELCVSDL